MTTPQSYVLRKLDPSVTKPLRPKIKETGQRRKTIAANAAKYPVGGKASKNAIAAAQAEYLANPSEQGLKKLESVIKDPAAAEMHAHTLRKTFKGEAKSNVLAQVEMIREVAPHAAKIAEHDHAAAEASERKLAESLGLGYRPSSGTQALAEIAAHFRNLANLPEGTLLSEGQIDGVLSEL